MEFIESKKGKLQRIFLKKFKIFKALIILNLFGIQIINYYKKNFINAFKHMILIGIKIMNELIKIFS